MIETGRESLRCFGRRRALQLLSEFNNCATYSFNYLADALMR
jgi:hypothetical protein